MNWPKRVRIWEVGPRDGLQNEPVAMSTDQKVAWIDSLSASGLSYIEVSSFVSPKWIPALADADEVCRRIVRQPGVAYGALVPNERGLERALEGGVDVAAVFMSASESHNRSNINKSLAETFPILRSVMSSAKGAGMGVRAYVSTAFGCPYEGEVDPEQVLRVALQLLEDGADEVSLGDTIGVSTPAKTERVLAQILADVPPERLALHMHDTRGTALANVVVALQMGIETFDAALGGLGGCPYAPGASGNVATDDLYYLLSGSGVETGIDPHRLCESRRLLERFVGRALPSHASAVWRAGGGSDCESV